MTEEKRVMENGSASGANVAENGSASTPLVEVRDLKKYFPVLVGMFRTTPLKAVYGVSSPSARAKR